MRAVALVLAAHALAGCLCTRHRPLGKAPEDTPRTLSLLLDRFEEECARGEQPRIALCDDRGGSYAWTDSHGVIWSRREAWSIATGALVFEEHRSWSDVAICIPDAVTRWGRAPGCAAPSLPACGAIADLRARLGAGAAPPR